MIFIATILGVNFLFNQSPNSWSDSGVLFMFYGLYFGLLGRDISEICTDKMTTYIGYYSPRGLASRSLEPDICAICGNKILSAANEGILENTYKLSCEHTYVFFFKILQTRCNFVLKMLGYIFAVLEITLCICDSLKLKCCLLLVFTNSVFVAGVLLVKNKYVRTVKKKWTLNKCFVSRGRNRMFCTVNC